MSQNIPASLRHAIIEECRRRGLSVDEVRRRSEVLLLYPTEGESLPEADQLAQLADCIELQNVRYVALALDRWVSTQKGGQPDD